MFKKFLFSLVLMAVGFTSTSFAQETLTVYDEGATNAYVPVYGFYTDAFLKAEFIMNSNDLVSMTGCEIQGLSWYLSSPASDSWGDAIFQIFVKEVTPTTIDAYSGLDGATIVYEGPLDGTREEMVIEFTTPYTYQGGNLLIGVYGIQKGTYKSATFSGAEVIGAAVQGEDAGRQLVLPDEGRELLARHQGRRGGAVPQGPRRPSQPQTAQSSLGLLLAKSSAGT